MQRSDFIMKVETAKKILSRWLPSIQSKDLQEAAKKVLVELDKSEEKILLLKKRNASDESLFAF